MKPPLFIAAIVMAALSLLAIGGSDSAGAYHGGSHTCAINAEQAGANPSTGGIWAYDFRFTNEGGVNLTDYDPPSFTYDILGVCLYTANGDQFDVRYTATQVVSSDNCYTVQFYYAPVNEDGLRVFRSGGQPPCEALSYMDVLIGGNPVFKQGDTNCDNMVTSVDALMLLRHSASLDVFQNEPCPALYPSGTMTWYGGKLFADVDCGGTISSADSLKVLRHVSGLSVSQTEPCPDIGSNLPTS